MRHTLKIWPQFFSRVLDGTKTFEVRNNDRGYQAGDTVELREWNPEINPHDNDPLGGSMYGPWGFTGRAVTKTIGYVYPINSNQVVFSLLEVNP